MSVKSSLGIARVLSTLDWERLGECVHVTHTFHWTFRRRGRDVPIEQMCKRDIQLAKIALVKAYAARCAGGVWKLEFQTRSKRGGLKVPHFHVLVWLGGADRAAFEQWVAGWWSYHSGNYHAKGTLVSPGDGRSAFYFALHGAKRDQNPAFPVGRMWGYINRDVVLGAQDLSRVQEEGHRQFTWWARLYRRCTGIKVRQVRGVPMGFSWFLTRAGQTQASAWIAERIDQERRERYRPRNPF